MRCIVEVTRQRFTVIITLIWFYIFNKQEQRISDPFLRASQDAMVLSQIYLVSGGFALAS